MYRVIRKAHKRAGRRFKKAMAAGVAVDGNAPETRLWTEAERLIDSLERAQKRALEDEEAEARRVLQERDGYVYVLQATDEEVEEFFDKVLVR